jgi:hypothetical protein
VWRFISRDRALPWRGACGLAVECGESGQREQDKERSENYASVFIYAGLYRW